jgi:SOS response regulatory protein OraA/RecX
MKEIIPNQKVQIEVEISGHVTSREELSEYLFAPPYRGHKFRGVVHIDDHMEWEWFSEEEGAEDWVKNKLNKYIKGELPAS